MARSGNDKEFGLSTRTRRQTSVVVQFDKRFVSGHRFSDAIAALPDERL
jgi:hypothetical protein